MIIISCIVAIMNQIVTKERLIMICNNNYIIINKKYHNYYRNIIIYLINAINHINVAKDLNNIPYLIITAYYKISVLY